MKIKVKETIVWLGVMLIFAVISWGLIVMVNTTPSKKIEPIAQTKTPAEISKNDITLGSEEKAKATLIEYADFQCPACKVYAENVKKLNEDFGDNLFIVYRFLPLDGHKNALSSAQAAYAAHKQNKFWEMDELLYKNQDLWAELDDPQQTFMDYAKKLNLNINQFTSDYDADSTKEFINAQKNEGSSLDIAYIPSFFVNGKFIETPQDYEAFKKIIQEAISAK